MRRHSFRLLVWASSYGQTIGGGPVLAPLLAKALSRLGHEVIVLTDRRPSSLPEEELRDGVRVIRPPFRQALAGNLALTAMIRKQIRALKLEFRPHLNYIFSSGYGEIFHHDTRTIEPAPMMVNLHDAFSSEVYGPGGGVGRNLRAAAWVTACSDWVLSAAIRHVPAIVPKSSVLHNGLPEPGIAAVPAPCQPPHLLFIGRLVPLKGADVLLAAFQRLLNRFPELTLSIVGSGDEEAKLKSDAARFGLGEQVKFRPNMDRDSVLRLMAEATLVVMPSRVESFGLVALEAAQMCRTVVASAVGGLPEVIDDGRTGVLVPPDQPDALADAIASLLEAPDHNRALAAAANARATDLFGWDRYVEAHERLFEQLIVSCT